MYERCDRCKRIMNEIEYDRPHATISKMESGIGDHGRYFADMTDLLCSDCLRDWDRMYSAFMALDPLSRHLARVEEITGRLTVSERGTYPDMIEVDGSDGTLLYPLGGVVVE